MRNPKTNGVFIMSNIKFAFRDNGKVFPMASENLNDCIDWIGDNGCDVDATIRVFACNGSDHDEQAEKLKNLIEALVNSGLACQVILEDNWADKPSIIENFDPENVQDAWTKELPKQSIFEFVPIPE